MGIRKSLTFALFYLYFPIFSRINLYDFYKGKIIYWKLAGGAPIVKAAFSVDIVFLLL